MKQKVIDQDASTTNSSREQDIVEQSGRPVSSASGGVPGQEHPPTAGVKRGRGEGEGMGHNGLPPGFGSDKQHAW